MKINSTLIPGCTIIDLEPASDALGLWARSYDEDAFRNRGIPTNFPHANVIATRHYHSIRGLYFTLGTPGEGRLVRVLQGKVFQVAVDLRERTPTYRLWLGMEMSVKAGRQLYIPPGCAYGYMTLTDDCAVEYKLTCRARPEHFRTIRWNDPAFRIEWPHKPRKIAQEDMAAPDWTGPPKGMPGPSLEEEFHQ